MGPVGSQVVGIVQLVELAQPPGAGSAQLLSVDAGLGVNGEDAVGAVLAVAIVPDRLNRQGEALAGDSTADHVLIINMKLNVCDGLAVLEALVDLLLQGLHSLDLLGLNGFGQGLCADVNRQQLWISACAPGAGAEHGKLEATGQLFTDPDRGQVFALTKGGEDHLLADGSLEVILDVAGKGEGLRLGGGDGHGVVD